MPGFLARSRKVEGGGRRLWGGHSYDEDAHELRRVQGESMVK
jgi:hypothetical protein